MIQLVRLEDHVVNFISFLAFFLKIKKKNFSDPVLSCRIFGQVVLWFRQVKYTLHLSKRTSKLRRKFPALCIRIISVEFFNLNFNTDGGDQMN